MTLGNKGSIRARVQLEEGTDPSHLVELQAIAEEAIESYFPMGIRVTVEEYVGDGSLNTVC